MKKCLAKEPEKRWQGASDLCDELKWIVEGGSQARLSTAVIVPARKNWRKLLVWTAASVAACAIGGLAVWILKPAPPKPVTRFAISLPAGQHLAALDLPAVALSPDGTRIAYIATQGGTQRLYLRAMDSPEAEPVPGTEGAVAPFFSPDSQWVAFFAGGALKKVSASGGAAVTLCAALGGSIFYSGSWGPGDTIVFNDSSNGGLWTVSAAGGASQQLMTLKPGDFALEFPEILPSGKAVLFTGGSANDLHVGIRSQQSGERRDLMAGTRPSYAPTGHLVYAQAGTLMAVPFDSQRLGVTGSPVPVLEGVLQSPSTGVAQYSFSSTGSVAYVAGSLGTGRKLVWVDRKGAEQPLPAPAHSYRSPRLSPDGRRVAVAIAEQGANIWLYDLARETLTRLTFGGGSSNTPIWTPDGKRIAFNSSLGGPVQVFWQLADGSGTAERLTAGEAVQIDGSWSPDGQVLAFVDINPATGRDIWILHVSGDRKPQPFLRTQFNETAPSFSPDGRWLAYASDESGRYEIYVQPYPGPGGKWQISTEGGTEPAWGHNGEIFYRSGDKMIAVETTTQPTFSADKPKVLFVGHYVPSLLTNTNYDVSPNGQRFVMIKEDEQAATATQINVVLNWFEELKQKVPTGKK